LASKSPARLKLLREAGLNPEVMVSAVDEDAVVNAMPENERNDAQKQVANLARAKAEAVLDKIANQKPPETGEALLILGLDSLYEFEDQIWGKPRRKDIALERIRMMSGKSGRLHTGHHAILADLPTQKVRHAHAITSTDIHFDTLTDEEIHAYVETEEPLNVAGSFTIDSFGSAFIREISGDYHSVVGVSPHTIRSLVKKLGVQYTDLWNFS
jgi:septum formation protein